MGQSPSSSRTFAWKIVLIVGALAGALTVVNIVLGATTIPAPESYNTVPPPIWGELIANLVLYGVSGFFAARGGRDLRASAIAGMLTGIVGALLATLINVTAVVAGSQAVLTFYNNTFGEAGPAVNLDSVLFWFGIWGLVGVTVGVLGGVGFGALGGLIGRAARKRA